MEPVRSKKRIKRAEAETRFSCLPEGIVVHILTKLPVKSLLQFRCVSQYWRSLISDPKFNLSTQRMQVVVMSTQIQESKYTKAVFVHLIDDKASVKELPMPEPLRGALIANGGPVLRGSCKGLVLVSYNADLFLWNPSTRWCNKVLSHWRLRSNYRYGYPETYIGGLCYDCSSDDYKAVLAARDSNLCLAGSLRNKTWTQINFCDRKKDLMLGPTVNDRVHWLVHSDDSGEDPLSQVIPYLIVSFDPQTDELVELQVPQNERIKRIVLGFGVLDGCLTLALSAELEGCKVTDVEVFAMKTYGDKASWTSLFVISNLTVLDPLNTSVVPLCSTTKGEVLFQREVKGGVMAYNHEHNSYRDVQMPSRRGCIYCSTPFVESLGSPASYNWETKEYTEISPSGHTRKYNRRRRPGVDLSK